MNKPMLVIFDFDGTIADTAAVLLDVANEILPSYGVMPIEENQIDRLKSMKPNELRKEYKIPRLALPKLARAVLGALRSRIDTIEPIDGMLDLLKDLKDNPDIDVALLSSNTRVNIDFFIEKHGLGYVFDDIETDVSVFGKKRRLKKQIKKLGRRNTVLYIGDETRDMEAARKAHITPVGVSWGFNSAEVLAKNGAHSVAKSAGELSTTITALVQ